MPRLYAAAVVGTRYSEAHVDNIRGMVLQLGFAQTDRADSVRERHGRVELEYSRISNGHYILTLASRLQSAHKERQPHEECGRKVP